MVKSWDWDQYCRAVFTVIKTYRHSLQGRWHLAFEKNCINLKWYLSFQENTSSSAHWYLRNLYHHILRTCFLFCAVSFSSKIITQHRSIHGFLSFFLSKGIKKKKNQYQTGIFDCRIDLSSGSFSFCGEIIVVGNSSSRSLALLSSI